MGGCVDCELGILGKGSSASIGLVSLSVGMVRVVTMWVTSFEKNFSSLCSPVSDKMA